MHCLKDFQKEFIENTLNPKKSNHPKRYQIYQNNWRVGLIRALSHTYPVCEKLVGKRFFEAMANQYVQNHHSTFFSLNNYGFDFPDFIKNFPPAQQLPYLTDVAKLEWATHRVEIGPPNDRINNFTILSLFNQMEQKNLNTVHLTLVKNSQLIISEYPIHKIWKTNQDHHIGEIIVNLDEGPAYLLVWRTDLQLRIDSLEKQEWEILDEINANGDLSVFFESEFIKKMSFPILTKKLSKFIENGYILLTPCVRKDVSPESN
jgi:hypothetical protein